MHLFIYGDVIGVGFRYWTVSEANKIGLKGWVKNLPDAVEAIFEGNRDRVEKMIEFCKQGPPAGLVKHVDVKWEKYAGEFDDFHIAY